MSLLIFSTPLELNCEVFHNRNGDQQLFKGIYMRYVGYIVDDVAANNPAGASNVKKIKIPHILLNQIRQFINDNAYSIQQYAKNNQSFEHDAQRGNPAPLECHI